MSTPDKVEEFYQLVLSVAKPLYDPDSDHVDIAIFEEQLFRKLESALTQHHQDMMSDLEKKIEREMKSLRFTNCKGRIDYEQGLMKAQYIIIKSK